MRKNFSLLVVSTKDEQTGDIDRKVRILAPEIPPDIERVTAYMKRCFPAETLIQIIAVEGGSDETVSQLSRLLTAAYNAGFIAGTFATEADSSLDTFDPEQSTTL